MCQLAILMTAYNSEAYIQEQITSILSQTNKDWDLFVRDDQSTDSTPTILSQFAKRDRRIHVVPDVVKRGAKHGFMWLLQQVEAQFYMFCDHDDVWLPTKIEKSLALMKQQKDLMNRPLIVCPDVKLVDEHLQVIAESYWSHKHHRLSMFSDRYYHLFYNNVLGCTMLLNRKARDLSLPYPPDTAMHDSWLALTVLWHGGRLIPLNEQLMLYRQHSGNTIGTPPVPSLFEQLSRISRLMKKTKVQYDSSRHLTHLSYIKFFLLKLKYMLRIHWDAHK